MVLFLKLQSIFVLVCLTTTQTFGFDYCADKSCREFHGHTMCKYPSENVTCEEDLVQKGLTEDQKRAILDRHNVHRQTVALGKQSNQPPARNMMKLTWHDEAERIAQRWANQCNLGHDHCRNIKNSYVGQNVAYGEATTTSSRYISYTSDTLETVLSFIDGFFDEVKDFDERGVNRFPSSSGGKVVGHYTQMVWAKTTGVGCGYVEVMKRTPTSQLFQSLKKKYFLVCNYVPGGNYIDEPIYKKGKSCSKCPKYTGCSKSYKGLCTRDKNDIDRKVKKNPWSQYMMGI